MNEYMELRNRQQAEFNALPLGFAFSGKQFREMMEKWGLDPEKDFYEVQQFSYNGYVQKKDATQLHETLERHNKEMETAIAGDKTGDGFIYQMFLCELDNHEYSYTEDVDDALDALGYTAADIQSDRRLKHGLEKACAAILRREDT